MTRGFRRGGASIAMQLLTVFFVATGLTAAMVVINVKTDYDQSRKAAAGQVAHEARTQARDLVATYTQQLTSATKSVAGEPGLRNARPGHCGTAVSSWSALIGGGGVALVDPAGHAFCVAGHYTPVDGAAPWFRKALSTGVGFGGPVFATGTHRPQIGYAFGVETAAGAAVLVAEQDSAGVLLGAMSTRLELYVVDRASGIVLDSLPKPAAVGSTLPADLRGMPTGRSTTATGPHGTSGIYASQAVGDTGWLVVAGMPTSRALASATQALRRNLVLGGLMVVVLLGLGAVVYRRIARPARRLRKAIDRIAEADVVDRDPICVPPGAPRELVELGHALNDMVDARRRTEARLASLVRHASDLVFIVDPLGVVTYATPRVSTLLAIDDAELIGRPFLDLVHRDDRAMLHDRLHAAQEQPGTGSRTEFRLVTGLAVRHVEARTQPLVDDPAIAGTVVTCHDITDRKRAEVELAHAAMHDTLTGLPNRALALDRLHHLLARTGRSGETSAVLFVDLDRFKLVNDASGHAAGDELLVQVAHRLRALTRPGDTLSRFGGDEFVIVCESLACPDDAARVAERVLAGMQAPFTIRGQETFVTASIGIAIAEPGDDEGGLLRDADAAMYRAKESGRAAWAMFDDGMREHVQRRLELGNKLRRALIGPELFLEYQPVVALPHRGVVGLEALVRWQDRESTVRPDEFIPVAEETGLIVPIGEWVLHESCRQLVRWNETPGFQQQTRVSVNVSARQIGQPDFADTVARILDDTGLDPRLLVVEVTESVLMLDHEAGAAMLAKLQRLGVGISVDDFGTGYSSLGYLQRLPIDELKIDRSFVAGLVRKDRTLPILESIVSLGHAIGLTVVAEGVETQQQAHLLTAMGCDRAQGFLFARPLPAAAALDHLTRGVAASR